MSNREFKLSLIDRLKSRGIFTQQVSSTEIRTRCPFCGDSIKNSNTGHLYIRINPDDNLPLIYNCFKCPAQGILKYEDLELLGVIDDNLRNQLRTLNSTSDKFDSRYEEKDIHFEYKIPDSYDPVKIKYIENRLNLFFTEDDLKDMKVITSLREFLRINNIEYITCKPTMAAYVEQNYVGFLTNNNSYILFRDITDKSKIRWYKYPITKESQGQKIFYTMMSSLDMYTNDDIIINMSEGVFDCIGISRHFYNDKNNVLNVAVCGKYYNKIIKHLFTMGLLGNNIVLNVFADNDSTEDTSLNYYNMIFKRYSYLVKEFNVYYNVAGKDYGVSKDDIMLHKHRI